MTEDKSYMLRKIAVFATCIVVFITVGLIIVNFQSKLVTVDYYGKVKTAVTMSNTVEGFLMQNKIYIDEKAVIYPSKDTRITNKMEIRIYSEDEQALLDIDSYREIARNTITEKKVEEIQYINYGTTEKSNASIARGVVKTLQNGSNGEKRVVYTISMVSGKTVSTNVITEELKKEAINQVIEVGTKITTVSRSKPFIVSASDISVDAGFKKYNIRLSEDLQRYAYNMCKKYAIPYEAFLAMMYVESGYGPNKISATNDYGLCQINVSNHAYLRKALGVSNFLNPYENIKAGAYFLSRYYSSWSDELSGEELTINVFNSYNMGEGAYRTYLKRGNSSKRTYSTKILNTIKTLISNGGL